MIAIAGNRDDNHHSDLNHQDYEDENVMISVNNIQMISQQEIMTK